MRIGWVGFHMEGIPALRAVLEKGIGVEAVLTLKQDLAARRSGSANYDSVCRAFDVPLYEIANINDEASLELLRRLDLDVAFVIGWTQIVRPDALRLAKIGMIGAHASLLPHNRGRAPINWALIKGMKETGNTLIWLAEGVDSGDIIDQRPIPIMPYDTCASLYERVAETNRDMILEVIPKLMGGEKPGRRQPHTDEPNLPGRKPEHGLINWSGSNLEVYDFVRALTRPYPGAFSRLDGQRWTIWQCALLPGISSTAAAPGRVIGPMLSPVDGACGQVIGCGQGAIALLEIESESGEILSGRRLSDQQWEGKSWTND
jgi:methionyl-tRNA formyltransferase